MSDWSAELDRYEAALDSHARLLQGDESAADRSPWSPPALPAGSVPAQHRARAEALLSRTEHLVRQVQAFRDSLPPLSSTRRPPSHAYTTASSSGLVDRSV